MTINQLYVLTGGPCSGKTTTLLALEKKGYKVIYETARLYIDQEMTKGKTLKEIRRDEIAFQRKILEMKIRVEKELVNNHMIFLERGIPDSIAYYKICGVDNDPYLNETLKNCFYKKVFLLELFPYKKDYARTEDGTQAKRLQQLLEKSYKILSIPVIKVPVMSLKKRINFILNNL